ncbi:hypothetical protein C8J56DRAFT_894116 [Mycena floridula]|nr:hypothetical protein C8J56DRAFT_894116 [Mycena floridula]
MTSFQLEHPILSNPADWRLPVEFWSLPNAVKDSWSSLLPLFATKGYIEHPELPPCIPLANELAVEKRLLEIAEMNGPVQPESTAKESYPFPRVFFRYKCTDEFLIPLPPAVKCFWDREKRDVVLKMVHGNELKILQYLNTPEMRANPMNRTIPVLEFITYEALTFAVMPLWQTNIVGLAPDFADVRQLMHLCRNLLEGLVFLHEHRIVHGDIDSRNMAFNAIFDPLDEYPTGLVDPGDTEFVFIDFDRSSIYPLDTDLDNVASLQVIYTCGNQPPPAPPLPKYCNPFRADVLNLAHALAPLVRSAQDIIPELIPFFEEHTNQDMEVNLSARKMLDVFQTMYSGIPREKLDTPVTGRHYFVPPDDGRIALKTDRPSTTRDYYIQFLQDSIRRRSLTKKEETQA